MSRLRTNIITNRMANGAPTVSNGLVISGVTTTSDIKVGTGVTLNVYGGATYSGIVTATSYRGDGSQLTGITAGTSLSGSTNNTVCTVTGANAIQGEANVQIDSSGRLLIGTTTAVRVLTIKDPGQIHVESTSTGNWVGMSIKGSSGTNNYNAYFGMLDSNGNFFIDNGSNGNDFVITQSGQVSISSGLNVTGVGTFGGVTIGYDTTAYSPIQKSDNTWFYTRLDQSSSISGTNIINLAQGSSKISDSIPRSVMTRQSDAGSYSLYHSSTTNGSANTNFSAADPFSPSTHGLTMGCLVRLHESGNNGSGVIFYGDVNSDNHFFVRYKYSSGGLRIGEDTDGSDVWNLAYPTDRFTNDNWYFVIFAVAGNGTLYVSLNGEEKIPIRTVGSPPTPTDARFGVCGDPYADNDSRHRYATMFWYKGLMPNDMIKAEYDWLKTIWTGASLP